ncbi:hypothetical protein RRG08_064058 [Elysia crispata]|uniref:Ferritin n=1 Tax=Elysia crispata TaxID=231223 RepID=A0AAE0YF63_9GAST|nr:hypothetical protein RRG08_064058 [Elysia crispata]
MESTAIKIFVFAFWANFASSTQQNDFVATVQQNYKPEIDDLLKEQIRRELTASYIYQAYASYFQRADVSLPGLQKFFADASLEERDHAQKLIDYVNKRGGHAQFDTLDLKMTCDVVWEASKRDGSGLYDGVEKRMCVCGFVATGQINYDCPTDRAEWKEGLMAFEDALVIERYVNAKLLELHAQADNASDPHLGHILEHDFLDEQVHAIYEVGQHVFTLRKFASGNGRNYKLGEYIFDEHLQKKSG